MFTKIKVVEEILNELDLSQTKKIYVFNKIDTDKKFDKIYIVNNFQKYYPQFISARNTKGIDQLLKTIEDNLNEKN
ncbi:hypothetical protein A2153_02750 [Candidatus Gottesmanbacteria bacterium RBG_16_38_7b]|nr:MAG: hypothetical protein A2153_02750 [Candidatus Gottesmanbacteria bacterium RBG_16_38_7b]